ncbi:hypothetical protein [Tardiphaga robiniae]|uniref:hypothetical protein n=1 Tax=Tardiphaga robiniae TaxID=943830 RepID=UPI0015867755|nr:hypothetical protein [Tardiphaga robiniae]NUU41381.1 hypothetical protein [Tardiphaga robiniae]
MNATTSTTQQSTTQQQTAPEKSARRVELEKMSDDDLLKYTIDKNIDLGPAKSRDDAIALIEKHDAASDDPKPPSADLSATAKRPVRAGASTKSKKKAEGGELSATAKRPVRAGASTKSKKKAEGGELSDDQIEAIQKVWIEFSRGIPQSTLSSGVFELEKDKRRAAKDHDVPDGDYRVIGADWILSFDNGRFVEAQRGGPDTPADSYASVPAIEHRLGR